MQNPLVVSQGEGFIRQYLEMDVQEGKPGADQALEWFYIIESALAEDRNHISDLERKISQTRLIMS